MSSWKSFLESQGAHWGSADIITHFETPEPALDENTTYLADLSHLGILSVTGPDAAKFLQGQVTCDIRDLDQGLLRPGAHCNHKGRMLSSFRALKLSEEKIALCMHRDIIASSQQSLGKYIVFSKAELADESEHYRRLGLSGPRAAELIERELGKIPETDNTVTMSSSGCIIRLSAQRFECWVKPEQAEDLWKALGQDAQAVGTECWTLLDIREGLGHIQSGTEEMFIPQMLNFQAIDGISFNKGCYTGQEIVARMQYLGKLKRHMYRASLKTEKGQPLPAPGSDVYSSKKQQSVGNIVMSAARSDTSDNTIEVLLVSTAEACESNDVHLDQANTKKFDILSLPYAITKDDED